MPLVAQVKWTITDRKNKTGHILMHVNLDTPGTYGNISGDVLIDLVGYLDEVTRRFDVVITGAFLRYSITISRVPTGIKPFADVNSDVEEGAEFVYPALPDLGSGAGAAYRHTIPTFDHDLFPLNVTALTDDDGYDETFDLESLVMLLVQSNTAPDWEDEYGAITDNRGLRIRGRPRIEKRFKKSRR